MKYICLTVLAALGIATPAAFAQQTLFASNQGNSTIESYSSSGTASAFATTGTYLPEGLAVDSAGSLYVANFDSTIEKFNVNTGAGTLFANTGLSNPQGLAFDSAGSLYAANGGTNTIEKFNSMGTSMTVFASNTTHPGSLNFPTGLAFDSTGNLYVTMYNGNYIEKFNSTGSVAAVFASSTLQPGSLIRPGSPVFDSQGNLFVANAGTFNASTNSFPNSSIEKFNTTTGVGTVFASNSTIHPGILDEPAGLAFDSAGSLYAANYANNTIEKFDSTGLTVSQFTGTGLFNPTYLLFIPAPEPSPLTASVIGALGLGMLTFSARRRRNSGSRCIINSDSGVASPLFSMMLSYQKVGQQ